MRVVSGDTSRIIAATDACVRPTAASTAPLQASLPRVVSTASLPRVVSTASLEASRVSSSTVSLHSSKASTASLPSSRASTASLLSSSRARTALRLALLQLASTASPRAALPLPVRLRPGRRLILAWLSRSFRAASSNRNSPLSIRPDRWVRSLSASLRSVDCQHRASTEEITDILAAHRVAPSTRLRPRGRLTRRSRWTS